jgi:hypothetical protein
LQWALADKLVYFNESPDRMTMGTSRIIRPSFWIRASWRIFFKYPQTGIDGAMKKYEEQ